MTSTNPVFHVTASDGSVFGVAATTVRDAMAMAQERMAQDESNLSPIKAERVGRWEASYGTVIAY